MNPFSGLNYLKTIKTSNLNASNIINFPSNFSKWMNQEQCNYIRHLPKDTFNPALWNELNHRGPTDYHRHVKSLLKPGYLWMQELTKGHVAVHWASESSGWIHRAVFDEEDKVIVNSFISHIMCIQDIEEEMTIKEFQKLISEYLIATASKTTVEEERCTLTAFEKKLEIARIICKITRAACKRLAQLREQSSSCALNVLIVIGIAESPIEVLNPSRNQDFKILEISKYFLNGRLPFLHEEKANPEEASELIVPLIHSRSAFNQIESLRKMKLEKEKMGIAQLDLEITHSVSSAIEGKTYENSKVKNLQGLKAWLILGSDEFTHQYYQSEKLDDKKSEEDRIELFIDFQKTWKLKLRCFEKF